MAGKCEERKELKIPAERPFLPQDIVVDILSRMSVKSLMRMKCVCPQWNDLIEDRNFIRKHMSRSKICYEWKDEGNAEDDEGNAEDDEGNEEDGEGNEEDGDDHDDKPKEETFRVVCDCDGMLLKRSNAKKYVIENPATRKILYLPDPVHDVSLSISFCFVPSTDKYKLVSIYEDAANGNEGCEIITAGFDSSWRRLELPNSHGLKPSGRKLSITPVGPAVHCFRVKEVGGQIFEEVISLDLESECFTSTTLRRGLFSDWKNVWVMNWNGRPALAEVGEKELEVLVIEDYRKQHKLAEEKFRVPVEAAEKDLQPEDDLTLWAEHGYLKAWLGSDKTMVVYDMNNGLIEEEMNARETRYICRESLATLEGMQSHPTSQVHSWFDGSSSSLHLFSVRKF